MVAGLGWPVVPAGPGARLRRNLTEVPGRAWSTPRRPMSGPMRRPRRRVRLVGTDVASRYAGLGTARRPRLPVGRAARVRADRRPCRLPAPHPGDAHLRPDLRATHRPLDPGYGYPPVGPLYGYVPVQKTNGLAIASLVCSLVWLGGVGSILAIIFGFIARSQIKKSEGAVQGNGLALAGIIIGFVGLVAVVGFVIVVVAAGPPLRPDRQLHHQHLQFRQLRGIQPVARPVGAAAAPC